MGQNVEFVGEENIDDSLELLVRVICTCTHSAIKLSIDL